MNNEITNVAIEVLKVHPRNTEFFDDISGKDYENFKNSIQEEGIISEIIVAPDMTIISGHQRYKAAKELGIKMIPVRIREDLIDEDKKLKVLLAANFGRSKNNEAKQRKVAVEYVKLCGYKNGGDRQAQCQVGTLLSLDEIAKQLGTSKRNLQRALTIERNLTEPMKNLLDDGVISKTVATDVIASLSEEEQIELINSLDATKKYTRKEKVIPKDYNDLKMKAENADKYRRQSEAYKQDYHNEQLKSADNMKKTLELQSEIQELKKKMDDIQFGDVGWKSADRSLPASVYFCAGVMNFIRDYGGYVWITDYIDDLPERERNNYIKAIEQTYAWAQIMLRNINEVGKKKLWKK